MLSRIPPVRRSAPLVLAVFAVGAGIGALCVALTQHSSAKRASVKPVVARAPASTTTQLGATTAGAGAPRTLVPPSHEAGGAANNGTPLVPESANASFSALASHLEGGVGLAVAPLGEGPVQTFGSLQAGHAWSTMKVPVLVTLLGDYERSGQNLSPEQDHDAELALEQSDNAAAEGLFAGLKQIHGGLVPASEAVQETLRGAGDQNTVINTAPNDEGFTTWGQSIWSPTGEVRFYRTLARGCLLSAEDNAWVIQLMRNVIPSQRWGAGAAGYPSSVPLAFKGGWGPERGAGYLVRQTAIVGSAEHGYVVSMIARPAGGSFAQGVSMINALATWAREHVPLNTHEPLPGCVGPE